MTVNSCTKLWSTATSERYFLVPADFLFLPGELVITNLIGESAAVDFNNIVPFEITEEQARQWARDQLGQALGEVRNAVDEKFAEWRKKLDAFNQTPHGKDPLVTPDAALGLLYLLKQLPGVVGKGLSGDEQRVDAARNTMAGLQQRLKDSGINLGDEFGNFPDRLAALRRETERELEARRSDKDKNSPG